MWSALSRSRNFIICATISMVVALCGCKSIPDDIDPIDITQHTKSIKSDNNNIADKLGNISDIAKDGKGDAPELEHWDEIIGNADDALILSNNISSTTKLLEDKQDDIDHLGARYKSSQQQINDLIAEKNSLASRIYSLLGFTAAIGIAVSVAMLFFNIPKVAIPLAGASITLLTLTFLLEAYMKWLVMGLGSVLIIAVAIMVYQMVVHRRAVVDIFEGNNEARKDLAPDLDDRIFRSDASIMNQVQTSTTKKILKQLKERDNGT